ncbi:ketopantoate reductase family protein [Herbiconiux ginsengi]|uniref:2-dehydropantoate 2-reductase n=1 Tax=Herbiconiux ginsengi TaxID=381665 RepID=A0A1H3QNU4_9MICO|nr:2-dehydropantoate 2-reductase [Herbiconiux ginsengi]SDZ15232.1 ketopantoate reductase [Herbiconiux ginsengi]
MTGPRIAVLGAGANGASIGADLIRAGLDVTLIEQWPEHVAAMRERGLTVNLPDRSENTAVRVLHLCEVATLTEPFDVVLLLMKAYDSRWAAHLIEPHLAPDGLLVGVQNGMTVDAIAEVVGAHRTLGCVIEVSSTMFTPSVVERHSGPDRSWFAVGSLSDATRGREREVADLLAHAGRVEVVDDIRSAKWMKLVSNATTLVTTASLGLPMMAALEHPGMRELMLRSGQEALDVAVAAGHRIMPIFGLGHDDVSRPETVVETLLDTLYRGFVLPNTTTTILQDWTKRRHSEVDDLNGYVVTEAKRLGLQAPVNAAVVEVAHRIERHELDPSPENAALLRHLAGAGLAA